MSVRSDYFQLLQKKLGSQQGIHIWSGDRVTSAAAKLLNRKSLGEKLMDRILPLYEVSSELTKYSGLQSLYEGLNLLNPQYFRQDEVLRLLGKCHGLSNQQQKQLAGAVKVFLEIVNKTNLNPIQLNTLEILGLWWQIFPEKKPWDALKWLWQEGVAVPHSQSGFRSWWRFSQGSLPEKKSGEIFHPKKWVEICEQQTVFETAFEADRMAAVFSGEWRQAGSQGVCGDLPDCENCKLNTDCLWQTGQGNQEMMGIEEKIQRKKIKTEDVPELMKWLLSSNPEESNVLEGTVNKDAPLKGWNRERLKKLENLQPIGSKLIIRLEALRELCRNYSVEKLKPFQQFSSSRDIFIHFHQQLAKQKQEQFIIVLLDNKHRYLAEEDVTKGILNKSLVHPREVFASAIEHRAAALICVHNHPSGDPEPSQEDLRITERLVEVGKLVGIPVLDHVIVGGDEYTSFADRGLL